MIIVGSALLVGYFIVMLLAEGAPEYEELRDGTLKPVSE